MKKVSATISCPSCGSEHQVVLDSRDQEIDCQQCHKAFNIEGIPQTQKNAAELLKRYLESKQKPIATPVSIGGLETLTLRTDLNFVVQYVNSPFCRVFQIDKEDILGQRLSKIDKVIGVGLSNRLRDTSEEKSSVQDEKGRTWEIKHQIEDSYIDIVLQDVSDHQKFKNYINQYISSDLTELNPEDLETFKYPERRFMTVSFCDLRGFTQMSDTMPPEQLRTTMNAFLEEVINAIDKNGATVDKIVGDEVMALFGAPKYFKDHALRSIKTACDQMVHLKALQQSYSKIGLSIPSCGIGINTGDMIIGNIGASTRQDYTVIGRAVNVASRLCDVAGENQIICSEPTMKSALKEIPRSWEMITSVKKNDKNIKKNDSESESKYSLPDDLIGKVISVGPNIKKDPSQIQYTFSYLYALKAKGVEEVMPIISIESPQKRVELELNDEQILKNEEGKIFGKYRLLEILGKGGMGEVWKAKDSFGNTCAIKLLIDGTSANLMLIDRFKREAKILGKLRHRNLCHVYEVGEFEGLDYIAMEYIDGESLSESLNKNKLKLNIAGEKGDKSSRLSIKKVDPRKTTFNVEETLNIMTSIAEGVEYAHQHQIYHRDLKPANIMLRKNNEPVVMDFGLAKMSLDQESKGASISVSGQVVGTIEYMPPEQARSSKNVDQRADIYSLGAIMYQMLTGRKHFVSSGNLLSDALSLEQHTPKRLREWNPKIPLELETITLKALRPDPSDRYDDVPAFLKDLNALSSGSRIEARELTLFELLWRWSKRNKTISILSMSFLLIMSVALIIFIVNLNIQKTIAVDALKKVQEKEVEKNKLSRDAAPRFLLEAKSQIDAYQLDKAIKSLEIASNLDFELIEAKWLLSCLQLLNKNFDASIDGFGKLNNFKKSDELLEQIYELKDYPDSDIIWKKIQETFISLKALRLAEQIQTDRDSLLAIWKKRIYETYQEKINGNSKKLILQLKNISDSKPLGGVPLNQLTITHSPLLQNMSALKGAPLGKLDLKDTSVSDLSFLNQAPLEELEIRRCQINRLEVYESWNLKHFTVDNCPITNLNSLKNQHELTYIDITDMQINDISFLEGKPINHLRLNDLLVQDLALISALPLKILYLDSLLTDDFTFLKSMTLQELSMKSMKIQNLDNINASKLIKLDLEHSDVENIDGIKNSKLVEIDLSHTKINNIEVLKGMPLEVLGLEATEVTDIQVLKGMLLKELDIDGLSVKDLGILEGMPLEVLDIERNPVKNIKPLRGLPLRKLDMAQTLVKDLEPLRDMPLEELILHQKYYKDKNQKFTNYKVLQSLKNLKKLHIDKELLTQDDIEMLNAMPNLEWGYLR